MRIGNDMATRGYRLGQIGSASLVSLGHGTNDAQKSMGIIVLALVANGNLSAENFSVPLWVKVSCATAIALGTFMGGWRIIDTLGKKVTGDITPPQGFSAEASGATLILASSYFGYPLSTTQVVSGAVVGSGIGRGETDVNWGIAGRMGIAWVLTIPGAAAVAGARLRARLRCSATRPGRSSSARVALAGSVALFIKTRREDAADAGARSSSRRRRCRHDRSARRWSSGAISATSCSSASPAASASCSPGGLLLMGLERVQEVRSGERAGSGALVGLRRDGAVRRRLHARHCCCWGYGRSRSN